MKTIRWGMIGCGDVAEVKSGPALQKAGNSDARLHLYRCKISLCRPVRPEVNRIDLIRTSGGIRAVAQFEKKAACSTYAPLLRQGPTIMQLRGRIENSEEMS